MGKVRVEDAHGAPPTIPFWRGEAPSRTADLSAEVARLRGDVERLVVDPKTAVIPWLRQHCALDGRGAEQLVAYIAAGRALLGTVPTQETIIAERFFDEAGGMQLVLHAPFGGRITRAWGLALRKRFCLNFDFELQAAATDEGLVLSLGEQHSFPLAGVFAYLRAETVKDLLIPAVLQAPMFMSRWRWNATRALALLRFANGRRVPPQIQRMRAEDLLAATFPAATACQDNHRGDPPREIPDHPLVRETFRDCLTEAMDVEGLCEVLRRMEAGEIRCVAIDTPAPSPFSHEILNANPYAYLDDAPLEERRARAVEMRRVLPPDMAGDVGALDAAAIDEVAREAWPVVRDADELHDALLTLIWVPQPATQGWDAFMPALAEAGRASAVSVKWDGREARGWIAAERKPYIDALWPDAVYERALAVVPAGAPTREAALQAVVQGWMESRGPTTAFELAEALALTEAEVHGALLALESQGQVLRGQFRPVSVTAHPTPHEFCDRRLLARLTIGRLRKEIEPIPASAFMRFLFQWQHVAPGSRQHGERGLLEVVRQLAGFEAPSAAWEASVLQTRMAKYDPALLDRLCLSGAVAWGRLSPHPGFVPDGLDAADRSTRRRVVPTSVAPISVFPREDADWLLSALHGGFAQRPLEEVLSPAAHDVYRALVQRGASFFTDLARTTGRLPAEIEQGLWELVAAGLVTSDGFDNLRALLDPRRRKAEGRERHRRPRHGTGRWSLLHMATDVPNESPQIQERVARQLLRRYGVVFRDLLVRETLCVAWRDLLVQYRRMELRGEVRGGRFVSGFVGEQFALPEAVDALRAMRKGPPPAWAGQDFRLSGADPLNLVGVILPGERVPALHSTYIVFRDGVPVRSGRYRDAADTGPPSMVTRAGSSA
jgi:ATP-dependent Lhr-like helicase